MDDKRTRHDEPAEPPTWELERSTGEPAARSVAFVRVFGEQVFLAHPAPVEGALRIGRADDCDIVVNEHSVSRVHAILHFGESVDIEDAGSANGTRIGATVLRAGQRCRLMPGQLAELGAVLVTVDAPPAVTPKPRRIWDHEHFEARLEEECARTRGTGGAFAVARIAFEPRPAPPDLAFVEAALVGSLAEVDALASYAPAQYQVQGRVHRRHPEQATRSAI